MPSSLLFGSEKTCEYLLFGDFFDDTWQKKEEDFGFVFEEYYEDEIYIEIIDIFKNSPLFELEIDLEKKPALKALNGRNLKLENEDDFTKNINHIESLLKENKFINFEIYYLDDGTTNSYSLEKFEYDLDYNVNANIEIKEIEIVNKSRETNGYFSISLEWNNPTVLERIQEQTNNDEYTCYFDTQDAIEEVLKKIWSPLPESHELGSKYEITKLNLLEVSNYYDDDWKQFTLFFDMKKTVRNKTNLQQFPFDKLETKFDFVFFNGGTVFSYFTTDQEDIDYLNDNLLEWEIDNNFDEEWKKIDNYYDAIYFSFEIDRKNLYYIFKIMLPVIFIVLISFSVFWINNQEIEGKLNVSIVSLLALIAYNFVYGSDVPKIGSITVMDTFILIAYLFAGLSTFISVYSYFDYRRDKLKSDFNTLDLKMRYIAPIGYAFASSSICLIVYFK